MDNISMVRQAAETRSGGKIIRGRRVAATASPYLRPNSAVRHPQSPNWLSRIFSPAAGAARKVAKGVGDIISPVLFGREVSPSSSWSSSNSSSGNEDDGNDISSDGAEDLNLNGGPSEADKVLEEPQLVLWDTEGKRAIKHLILKEKFTRDECDRLTKIIQSRVVDSPHIKEVEDTRQKKLPDRTVGSSIVFPEALQLQLQTGNSATPNLCNTAIMEARKWLEEKKLQSSSKSVLHQGMYTSNSIMQLSVAEGDVGSPVDVAKSYMRARPPWASPSLSHGGSQTPSPIGTRLFTDGTPFGLGDQTLSSSKMLKRNTLATGSWDILEEIRRVRLKATKDISEPFVKQIDSSAIVSENIGGKISSTSDKGSTQVGGAVNDSNSLPAIQSVAGTAHLPAAPAGFCTNGSPVYEVGSHAENLKHGKPSSTTLLTDTANDRPTNGTLSSCPKVLVSERTQDLEDSQPREGEDTCSVFDGSLVLNSISVLNNGPRDVLVHATNYGPEVKSAEDIKPALPGEATHVNGLDDADRTGPPSVSPVCKVVQTKDSCQSLQCSVLRETHSINDSRTIDGNNVTQKEANVLVERVTTNGPSLASSLSVGVDTDPSLRPADEEEPNSISSGYGKLDSSAHLEGNCELFSEAFIEIPIIEESDSIVSGSQNGSDKQYGDSFENPLLLNSGDSLAGKSSSRVEKQEVKKVGRYKRRGRRRGKA